MYKYKREIIQIVKNRQRNFGIKQFFLPDLGEKIKEATVKQWHVKIGEQVEEFQGIADVATDKLFTTIPSSFSGKIHKIFHQQDQQCQVGELFLEIDVEDHHILKTNQNDTYTKTEDKHDNKKENDEYNQKINDTNSMKIKFINQSAHKANYNLSPAVQMLINQYNIDPKLIKPTGPFSRILKGDVLLYLQNKQINNNNYIKNQSFINEMNKQTQISFQSQNIQMNLEQQKMQKIASKSLTIPHFYLMEEIDLSVLLKIKSELDSNQKYEISIQSVLIKAISLSLIDFPKLNSSYYQENGFQFNLNQYHNIQIRLQDSKMDKNEQQKSGMMFGTLLNVERMNMIEIENQLKQVEYLEQNNEKATINLNYLSELGSTYSCPIVISPLVCSITVGKIQEKKGKAVANITFACDHRVLNGAYVTRFSQKLKTYLEKPFLFLIQMQ